MRKLVCIKSVAKWPNDRGYYDVEKWDTPSSESLNQPFDYDDELDDVLDAVATDARFAYWAPVTSANIIDEDGYVSFPLDKEFTLKVEDIRDKICTPVGAWPQEKEYYIIANDDEDYFWVVVYPSRRT